MTDDSRDGRLRVLPAVDIDPMVRGGRPCVEGTRVPVCKVLAEMASEGLTVAEFAAEYDQDPEAVRGALEWAAAYLDRPLVTRCPSVGPGGQCEYEEGHEGHHGASTTGWTAPRRSEDV